MIRCTQACCVEGAETWWKQNQHLLTGTTEPEVSSLSSTRGDVGSASQKPKKHEAVEEIAATEEMTVHEAATNRFPVDMERAWNRRVLLTDSPHSKYCNSILRMVMVVILLLVGFKVLEQGVTVQGDAARAAVAEMANSAVRGGRTGAHTVLSGVRQMLPDTARAAVAEMANSAVRGSQTGAHTVLSGVRQMLPDTAKLTTAAMKAAPEGIQHAATLAGSAGEWTTQWIVWTLTQTVSWMLTAASMMFGGMWTATGLSATAIQQALPAVWAFCIGPVGITLTMCVTWLLIRSSLLITMLHWSAQAAPLMLLSTPGDSSVALATEIGWSLYGVHRA